MCVCMCVCECVCVCCFVSFCFLLLLFCHFFELVSLCRRQDLCNQVDSIRRLLGVPDTRRIC